MKRRDALRFIGTTATAVVVASPALIVAAVAAKPKPEPLPPVYAGSVLTESTFNDIIDRLNELSVSA